MHSCLHLFTKEIPTMEGIEKIMEPFKFGVAPATSPIQWDWYSIGGRYHNQLITKTELMSDCARIKDLKYIINLECYCFIDMEGNALARDVWDGEHFVKIQDFDEQYQKVLESSKNGYLTVIDIHE